MSRQIMYPGKVNSPQTELASAIDDEQTTIPLLDVSVLPDPPNIATIGMGEDAETILYTGVSGNDLTGVTRGFQGAAKAWSAGVKVARNFTAYDYEALRQNLENHGSEHNHDGSDPIPDLVQLRSIGLGIDVDPRISSDLNNETQTGWVRFESGETANSPGEQINSFPHSGVVRVDRRNNNRLVQTAYGVAGATSVRIAVRVLGSAGWGDWVEILHTGNATPEVIGAETPSGAQAKVNAHASRTDNPHNVTKAQVGLGNVQNYGIATQAQAEAGTANNVYMTPLRVAQAIAALSPGIKSVQRGSGTIPFEGRTVDVTISTVNRNKAFVIAYSRGSTDGFYHAITAQLTSNTNLRITRGLDYGDTTPFTWEVVEFN